VLGSTFLSNGVPSVSAIVVPVIKYAGLVIYEKDVALTDSFITKLHAVVA
jgi:hypothetical protein